MIKTIALVTLMGVSLAACTELAGVVTPERVLVVDSLARSFNLDENQQYQVVRQIATQVALQTPESEPAAVYVDAAEGWLNQCIVLSERARAGEQAAIEALDLNCSQFVYMGQ